MIRKVIPAFIGMIFASQTLASSEVDLTLEGVSGALKRILKLIYLHF